MRATLTEVAGRYAAAVRSHRSLHLRCRLLRPLALNDPILLDGLLRVAVAKEYLADPALAGMPLPESTEVPLPLATSTARAPGASAPRHPYPLASLGYADAGARTLVRVGHPDLLEFSAAWHKTWEHSGDDYLVFQSESSGKPLRGKLSLGGAQYKGWSMRTTVVDPPGRELHFWARGDAEEVCRLLAQLPAVGKRQSWGHGLVAPRGWSVEEVSTSEDWSEVGPRGPTRPLPLVDWQDPPWAGDPAVAALSHGACMSPAYDARRWVDVWLPT